MRTDFKFLLIFLSLAQATLATNWNYEKQGADWTDESGPGPCKSGTSQSPIDLKTPKFDNNLKGNPMVFNNYDKDISESTIENDGHSIKLTPSASAATISNGGLDGTFELAQLHFHWGDSENKGSEHKIEGKAFPMEMHLVHFNKKYTDFANAAAKKDGLAVLGFFYEIDADGKDYEIFKKLNTPLQTLQTEKPKTHTFIQNFNLKRLLLSGGFSDPEKLDFYRYTGSLTTPGCNEVVTWTVFKDPLKLPQELMDEFRKQKLEVNNFREVQQLNGRIISANFDSSGSASPQVFWAMLGINAIALTFLIGW